MRCEPALSSLVFLAIVAGSATVKAEAEKGTLKLGGQTYTFDVAVCNMTADASGPMRTLSGNGQTQAGEYFSITGNVVETDKRHEHMLMVQDASTTKLAHRYLRDGQWFSDQGPVDGPLFKVTDGRVSARGTFTLNREPVGEGELDTPCPPPD